MFIEQVRHASFLRVCGYILPGDSLETERLCSTPHPPKVNPIHLSPLDSIHRLVNNQSLSVVVLCVVLLSTPSFSRDRIIDTVSLAQYFTSRGGMGNCLSSSQFDVGVCSFLAQTHGSET